MHVYDGACRFANQAHLDRFKQDPEPYLPQFGGFCAYGVSVSKKFDGDPRLWMIVDGKLHLNLNAENYATLLEGLDGNIVKADHNLSDIEHSAARDVRLERRL